MWQAAAAGRPCLSRRHKVAARQLGEGYRRQEVGWGRQARAWEALGRQARQKASMVYRRSRRLGLKFIDLQAKVGRW